MGLAAPPPARLKARTEFSVTLEMPPLPPNATGLRFEFREANERSWDTARQVETTDTTTAATGVLLDDLNPTSTYEIRIYALQKAADGSVLELSPPSDVAAVDTEVPGCAPEPKCTLQ